MTKKNESGLKPKATETDARTASDDQTDELVATFEKNTRGVSAPNSGHDTADHPENLNSYCDNCGHVGHEHDKERVYSSEDDDAPAGSYHYRYVCPGRGS